MTTNVESQRKTPPSGPWTGFYLEQHHDKRGWMHLFLNFESDSAGAGKATVKGEGTDYVGPWTLSGEFHSDSGEVQMTKQYLGKHRVKYQGVFGPNGILGGWTISSLVRGQFHIWPAEMTELQELYMRDELEKAPGSILLGGADGRPPGIDRA